MGVPRRSVVRGGLLGAIAAIYFALVGLYTEFAELELVGEQVTLGRLLLVAPALVAAYAATRPRVVAGERRPVAFGAGVAGGALTGLVTGTAFAAAVWFAEWFGVDRIREVFIQVSETLVAFLTFDQGVPAGLPFLIGLSVVGGAVGGLTRTAPAAARGPLTVGTIAVIAMAIL